MELCGVAVGKFGAAFRTFLGSYKNHTACGSRTVESGSRGAWEYRHRLDVVGVDVGNRAWTGLLGHSTAFFVACVYIKHRYTVDYIQGVVVACERLCTTHNDTCGGTCTGWTGADVDTCNLACEWVDEVGVLVGGKSIAVDSLHIVAERFLCSFDTESSYNDFVEGCGFGLHHEVDFAVGRHCEFYRAIADVRELQHIALLGIDTEFTVDVGLCAIGSTFDKDRNTNQGFATRVCYNTLDLGCLCHHAHHREE